MRKSKMFLNRFIVAMIVLAMYACSTEEPKKPTPTDDDNNNQSNTEVLTTSIVTDITPTTAKSGGSQINTASGVILSKGIVWNTSASPTIDHFSKLAGEGYAAFVCVMTDLQPNTKYYARAYITNQNGIFYGNEVSFTTLATKGTFTDTRDGIVYNWVKIGDQIWMSENLKYLPSVVGPTTGSQTTPYYYVYGYDGTSVTAAKATANYTTYGVLYNWKAACNSCPAGWHLPSDAEWTELTDYLGGTSIAGCKLKETGTTHWDSPNTGATNETGFTALPGGYRNDNGTVSSIGVYGAWWSATEDDATNAWYRNMGYSYSNVLRNYYYKELGFSVRCVRD